MATRLSRTSKGGAIDVDMAAIRQSQQSLRFLLHAQEIPASRTEVIENQPKLHRFPYQEEEKKKSLKYRWEHYNKKDDDGGEKEEEDDEKS